MAVAEAGVVTSRSGVGVFFATVRLSGNTGQRAVLMLMLMLMLRVLVLALTLCAGSRSKVNLEKELRRRRRAVVGVQPAERSLGENEAEQPEEDEHKLTHAVRVGLWC